MRSSCRPSKGTSRWNEKSYVKLTQELLHQCLNVLLPRKVYRWALCMGYTCRLLVTFSSTSSSLMGKSQCTELANDWLSFVVMKTAYATRVHAMNTAALHHYSGRIMYRGNLKPPVHIRIQNGRVTSELVCIQDGLSNLFLSIIAYIFLRFYSLQTTCVLTCSYWMMQDFYRHKVTWTSILFTNTMIICEHYCSRDFVAGIANHLLTKAVWYPVSHCTTRQVCSDFLREKILHFVWIAFTWTRDRTRHKNLYTLYMCTLWNAGVIRLRQDINCSLMIMLVKQFLRHGQFEALFMSSIWIFFFN